MKKEITVIESNSISEIHGRMSKAFIDTLHVALLNVALANDSPENLDYEWNVTEYSQYYGLKFDYNVYKRMEKEVDDTLAQNSMMSTVENGETISFFIFQEVRYNPKVKTVHVVFTRRFKNILSKMLAQKGRKIYFALPETLSMSSIYGKRMYPILLEFVDKPIVFNGKGTLHQKSFDHIYKLDEFKELLNISSYGTTKVKDVCNIIIREINEHTTYNAEVYFNESREGSGRYETVTHVCWNIKKKPSSEQTEAIAE